MPDHSETVDGSASQLALVGPECFLVYFQRMCAAGAVDCVQVDVTRCGGITELLRIAAVAAAHGLEISGHCAPGLHLAPLLAVPIFDTWNGFMTTSGSSRCCSTDCQIPRAEPCGRQILPDTGCAGARTARQATGSADEDSLRSNDRGVRSWPSDQVLAVRCHFLCMTM